MWLVVSLLASWANSRQRHPPRYHMEIGACTQLPHKIESKSSTFVLTPRTSPPSPLACSLVDFHYTATMDVSPLVLEFQGTFPSHQWRAAVSPFASAVISILTSNY